MSRLEGSVVDVASGVSVPGCFVVLSLGDPVTVAAVAETDGEGRFTFRSDGFGDVTGWQVTRADGAELPLSGPAQVEPPTDDSVTRVTLEVEVSEPESNFERNAADAGAVVPAASLSVAGDGADNVEEAQDVIEPVALTAVPLSAIIDASRIDLPDELREALADRGVETLDDLVRAADILEAAPAEDEGVRRLRANVDLHTLSVDVAVTARLIERGLDTPAAIADLSPAALIVAVDGVLPEAEARTLQLRAGLQAAATANFLTGLRADLANGGSLEDLGVAANAVLSATAGEWCACGTCESALGLRAYLTDLLEYAYSHLSVPGQDPPLARQQLADVALQDFDPLLDSCTFGEREVRQVRLAVEALRRLLGARPLADAAREAALAAAEHAHRVGSYHQLLTALGTSDEELRLVRGASAAARQQFADRLGVSLGSGSIGRFPRLPGVPLPAVTAHYRRPGGDYAGWGLHVWGTGLAAGTETTWPVPMPPIRFDAFGAIFEVPVSDSAKPLGFVVHAGDAREPGGDRSIIPVLDHEIWLLQGDAEIHVSPPEVRPDHLDALLLDPDVAPGAIGAVTDDILEWRFGLPGTVRESLSDGPKRGDDFDQIVRWSLSGADPGLNTDEDGAVHLSLRHPSPTDYRVELYRDEVRTVLLAEGSSTSGQATVEFIPIADSGLSGQMTINYQQDSDAITLGVVPQVLAWRQRRLQSIWEVEDHPANAFLEGHLTVIDPDLIGPDDFRVPHAKPTAADPDRAFDVWLRRRSWVDTRPVPTLVRGGVLVPDVDGLFARMSQPIVYGGMPLVASAWAPTTSPDDFAALLDDVVSGSPAAMRRIDRDLALSVAEFRRLNELWAKDRLHTSNERAEALNDDEWLELQSIVVQAEKRRLAGEWLAEEDRLGIIIGPEEFWPSSRDPQIGPWPPLGAPPLVDPETVTLAELAEPTVGRMARGLWQDRHQQLAALRADLDAKRRRDGVEAVLEAALGTAPAGTDWMQELRTLNARLSSGVAADPPEAVERIEQELRMDVADFMRLVATIDSGSASAEWLAAVRILASARMRRELHAQWAADEAARGLTYWQARKARLPIWRADPQTRIAWQAALRARSGPPLVDPDVLTPSHIRNLAPGSPAFDLWQARDTWRSVVLAEIADLRSTAADVATAYDEMLQRSLGITAAELDDLAKAEDPTGRLVQLGVNQPAFDVLRSVRALLLGGVQVRAAEWSGVDAILAQAEKRRRFGGWRIEEQAHNLRLDRSGFLLPAWDGLPPTPTSWLGDQEALTELERRLAARIAQADSVAVGVRDVIDRTESDMLPSLRDALVTAADAPSAAWLAGRLGTDVEEAGCASTSRVGHAIAVLQRLLLLGRMERLDDYGVVLELHSLDLDERFIWLGPWGGFDRDWAWLGSYASWRAAMTTFLNPENLLLPTLRESSAQSPGFQRLSDELQAGAGASPLAAREAARRYYTGFRDVASLMPRGSCALRTGRLGRNLLFVFADAGGRIYWSVRECEFPDPLPYAQTYWTPVPELDGPARVVGAAPYQPGDGPGYVYLVCTTGTQDHMQLCSLRYDVARDAWEPPEAIDMPVGAASFSAVVGQDNDTTQPPHIFMAVPVTPNILIFDRRLDVPDAPGGGWQRYWGVTDGNGWRLAAHHTLTNSLALLLEQIGPRGDVVQVWMVVHNRARTYQSFSPMGFTRFMGSLRWADAQEGLYLLGPSPGLGLPPPEYKLLRFAPDSTWALGHQDFAAALFATPYGYVPNSNGRADFDDFIPAPGLVPYFDGYMMTLAQVRRAAPQDYLEVTDKLPLRPLAPEPFAIDDQRLDRLESLRAIGERILTANADAPPPIRGLVEEALFHVPVEIAHRLQAASEWPTALEWLRNVYDFRGPHPNRKIYYGLVREALLPDIVHRTQDWFRDVLNPHLIAATRRNASTRFVVQTVVRCLVEWADAEFAAGSAESIARATELYTQAQELLNDPDLPQPDEVCSRLIDTFTTQLQPRSALDREQLRRTLVDLRTIRHPGQLKLAIAAAQVALDSNDGWPHARAAAARPDDDVSASDGSLARAGRLLTAEPWMQEILTGLRAMPGDDRRPEPGASLARALAPSSFCIPPNPELVLLRNRITSAREKLRACRSFAGAPRALALAADAAVSGGQQRPTPFRYTALAARARQLVDSAQAVEASFLATLERRDAARYDLMRARQDARLARAAVSVQALRAQEAEDGRRLAELQRDNATARVATLRSNAFAPMGQWERQMVNRYNDAAAAQMDAFYYSQSIRRWSAFGLGNLNVGQFIGDASFAELELQATVDAIDAQRNAQIAAVYASYESHQRDLLLQLQFAAQDQTTAEQQLVVAGEQVAIGQAELAIAGMQASGSEDVAEFLATKFTNVELYDWMSGVLERTYRWFLQQATTMARLASDQLSFERQEAVPPFIQADYVGITSVNSAATALPVEGVGADRRGLTGSIRLLNDLTRLDEYAFETTQRKLQLTKTISLCQLDPVAFVEFLQTGSMRFATPMELFERDFPAHYMRLLRRVRVTVLALVPPGEGIHATLSSLGISRVVTSAFEEVTVRRDPEQVALTSPANASGVFELEAQPELTLPFEFSGVASVWQLDMPLPANRFPFDSIADVELQFEYTALADAGYGARVAARLGREVELQRAFTFRRSFADGWYDLHNPDQTSTPMAVRFRIDANDFPANVRNPRICNIVLAFIRATDAQFELPVTLTLRHAGDTAVAGGPADSVGGLLSTRSGNAASWVSLLGGSPFGEWELGLPNVQAVRERFSNADVRDIVLVISYASTLPDWPR